MEVHGNGISAFHALQNRTMRFRKNLGCAVGAVHMKPHAMLLGKIRHHLQIIERSGRRRTRASHDGQYFKPPIFGFFI